MQATYRHGQPVMVDYTPSGAVDAGDVVVVNDVPFVAHRDIAADALGALAAGGGVYDLIADAAIGSGKAVYWDATNEKVTRTPTGHKLFGFTVQASAADGDTIKVIHVPGAMGPGAAITSLTDNSAGTANSTLQALADGTTYANDVAAIRNNFADLAAKVNEVIASLRTAGSIVS